MRKSEIKNLTQGKYYRVIYKDFNNTQILFRLKEILDKQFKTKIYLKATGNEYVDLKEQKTKNTHCLNWLGLLDITKIKSIEELKTV
tara:strand:- start:46 stop:306 length:261 start_codon:yes stop_codon:yes gene_type:complete